MNSMSGIKFSLKDMERAQAEIKNVINDFKVASDDLLKTITSITNSGWKGDDAEAFVNNASTLKKVIDDTIRHIENDNKTLKKQTDNYKEGKARITKRSNNLRIGG